MSAEKMLRWTGLSLIVGGVLGVLSMVIHPSQETAEVILSQTWRLIAGHALGTAAIVFVLLGLIGLYAVQAEKAGWDWQGFS
jgi:hypothetical protein